MRRVTLDQAASRIVDIAAHRLPPLGEGAWTAFWAIERTRQGGMGGAQSFTYAEIEAWTRLSQQPLAPWEVEALTAMDSARREVWGQQRDAEEGRPQGPNGEAPRHVVSFSNADAVERMFDRFGDVREA